MRDLGRSNDPRVQAQLDRLAGLSLPQGRFGLETMRALLERLGDPHERLPPVLHVAGTNGKGSTCAFLRAMLEAQGYRVHATISPHLVRYNERIRLAGRLVEDEPLAELLTQVLDAAEGLNPSFFEVTIAAAFLAFSRTPADVCVVEVGLGGRLDATNVLQRPAVCGIAALGLDHERFLLAPEAETPAEPMARIAFEKAGIAKPGVPLVTMSYDAAEMASIEAVAARVGAPWLAQDRAWHVLDLVTNFFYDDDTGLDEGGLHLPFPALAGAHQLANAGLAIAMLRHQRVLPISREAIANGLGSAHWPARLQRIKAETLGTDRTVWLDGGHNPSAGEALAQHFAGQRLHLITGMIAGKNPAGFLTPLQPVLQSITVVPVPHHEWQEPNAFGLQACFAADVPSALAELPDDDRPVLIAGSLYLAGEVLRLAGEAPD